MTGRILPHAAPAAVWELVRLVWLDGSRALEVSARRVANLETLSESAFKGALIPRWRKECMTRGLDPDLIYRRIGEYVVSFQWLEHKLREIGWLILDPDMEEWPPERLTRESNAELVDRVVWLFEDLMDSLNIEDAEERKADFRSIGEECHSIRRDRNRLLHSAFSELKAGDEVQGILRANPRLERDPETGEPLFDTEILHDDGFTELMKPISEVGWSLQRHSVQLRFWAPFDHLRHGRVGGGSGAS